MSSSPHDFSSQAELARQGLLLDIGAAYVAKVCRCAHRLYIRANGDRIIEDLAKRVADQANDENARVAGVSVARDIASLAIFGAQREAGWANYFRYPDYTTPDSFRTYYTAVSGPRRLTTQAAVNSMQAIKRGLYTLQPHVTPPTEEERPLRMGQLEIGQPEDRAIIADGSYTAYQFVQCGTSTYVGGDTMALVKRRVTVADGEIVSEPVDQLNGQANETGRTAGDRESIIAAWWNMNGESHQAASCSIEELTNDDVSKIIRCADRALEQDVHTRHMPKWYEHHWYALVPIRDEAAQPGA